MKQNIPAYVFAVMLFSADANADWIASEGEYNFGPEMAQSEACQKAERRAKEKALKSVTGEKISSEDNMVCSEMKDNAECSLNRFTWSTIDGLIRGTRNKKMETLPGTSGYRKCHVSLEVDVGVGSGKPDPGFDMTVRLNQRTFRNGEPLEISVSPTQPMHVSVFQWLPYMKVGRQVTWIFPNQYDEHNHFQGQGAIPTKNGRQHYDMRVLFPENLKRKKDFIDEYLMVVGTREPVKFRETYSLEEFNARLLEIPRRDLRLIRKAYNVVRPQ
jgi:hypothetical protein